MLFVNYLHMYNRFKTPVTLYYGSFQGDTSVVVLFVLCFGVKFLCCLNLMHVFIVLAKFG